MPCPPASALSWRSMFLLSCWPACRLQPPSTDAAKPAFYYLITGAGIAFAGFGIPTKYSGSPHPPSSLILTAIPLIPGAALISSSALRTNFAPSLSVSFHVNPSCSMLTLPHLKRLRIVIINALNTFLLSARIPVRLHGIGWPFLSSRNHRPSMSSMRYA